MVYQEILLFGRSATRWLMRFSSIQIALMWELVPYRWWGTPGNKNPQTFVSTSSRWWGAPVFWDTQWSTPTMNGILGPWACTSASTGQPFLKSSWKFYLQRGVGYTLMKNRISISSALGGSTRKSLMKTMDQSSPCRWAQLSSFSSVSFHK